MNSKNSNTVDSPFCVLIDTNVWVYKTNLLRTPIARAFLHYLRMKEVRILLPEVYEMEIVYHVVKHGKNHLEKAKKNLRILRTLTGKNFQPPPVIDFKNIAKERIQELDHLIHRLPFREAHARGALNRVMYERPPSKHKKQEFKDSAVWEAILEFEGVGKVLIFSDDGDFYEFRNKKEVLSLELEKEANKKDLEVEIYQNLSDFLEKIDKEEPTVNQDVLKEIIINNIKDNLEGYIEKRGLELLDKPKMKSNFFLTEDEGILSVEFKLIYDAHPLEDNEVYPEKIIVRIDGQCIFNVDQEEVSDVNLDRMVPLSTEGEELPGKLAYLRTKSMSSVRSDISRSIERIPLEEFFFGR